MVGCSSNNNIKLTKFKWTDKVKSGKNGEIVMNKTRREKFAELQRCQQNSSLPLTAVHWLCTTQQQLKIFCSNSTAVAAHLFDWISE